MQKTPNHTAVLILGIVSYIGCCFTYGILGIIMSAIGIILANKDIKLINENQNVYDTSVKTWKTVNIIALVLSILMLILGIFVISIIGFSNLGNEEEMNRILMEKFGQ
jgi:sulfite exporter TauE/SafE